MKYRNRYLKELDSYFSKIYAYKGNPESITSCDSEYWFNENDTVVTDGVIVQELVPDYDADTKTESVRVATYIRGAKYVIIATPNKSNELEFDLRLNEPFLNEELKTKLISEITRIKEIYYNSIENHIKSTFICEGNKYIL